MSAASLILEHLHDRQNGFDLDKFVGSPTATTFLYPDHPVGRQIGNLWIPPAESEASRKPPDKNIASCRGSLVGDNDNRELVFESGLKNQLSMLLVRRDVARVIDQPKAVSYKDMDGKPHDHTFDFLVHMLNGTRIAIAVKPEERVTPSGIKETLALIREQVGARFADRYIVRTERHLPRNKVADAELILRARRHRRHLVGGTLPAGAPHQPALLSAAAADRRGGAASRAHARGTGGLRP